MSVSRSEYQFLEGLHDFFRFEWSEGQKMAGKGQL